MGFVSNSYGTNQTEINNDFKRSQIENSAASEKTQTENKSIFLEDDGNGTFEMTDIKTDGIKDLGALKVMLQKYVGKPLAKIQKEINSKIEEFQHMQKNEKVETQMKDYVENLMQYYLEHNSTDGFSYTGFPNDIQDLNIATEYLFEDSSNDEFIIKNGKQSVKRNPDGFRINVSYVFDGKTYTVGITTNKIPNAENNFQTEATSPNIGGETENPSDLIIETDIEEQIGENTIRRTIYTVGNRTFGNRQEAEAYLKDQETKN